MGCVECDGGCRPRLPPCPLWRSRSDHLPADLGRGAGPLRRLAQPAHTLDEGPPPDLARADAPAAAGGRRNGMDQLCLYAADPLRLPPGFADAPADPALD